MLAQGTPGPGRLCQHRNGSEEARLSSPSEVKPQSLCPFPGDGGRSCPVAMIMRLEFDHEASNRKTYGVNLDALRLAHTRERAAQSPAGLPATPRPSGPRQPGRRGKRSALCAPAPPPRALGRLSYGRSTQPSGGVGRSLRLAKKGASWASPGACQVLHN